MTDAADLSLITRLRAALDGRGDGAPVLYRAMAAGLRRAIEDGVLAAGDSLPGERELSQGMGVSRNSVRRAMESLVADGVLIRRQGSRTAVAERVEKPLSSLTSFTEDMRARGIGPGMTWLMREAVPASPAEIMGLGLSVGAQVARLRRLRTGDGKPMAIEQATLPLDILPDPAAMTGSLYEELARRGQRPVRGLQRLRAATASPEDARLLALAPGAPLLVADRRCFAADGRPVEFTQSRYCGDRYDFVVELRIAD